MAWHPERALFPALILLTAVPIVAGLASTLAQALGGDGFARLAAWPGLYPALRLSLGTGLGSTALATCLSLLIVAALAGRPGLGILRRVLSPLLALPHAAAALGLAFLLAPSGWVARLLSPWATGWTAPPDWTVLNDPHGISLTLGLAAKETPFLLLMALAAWPQADAARRLAVSASLGYGRMAGFGFSVLPALARQMRLPIHAVLAYSMTSVDMGLVLGPSLPPPLAVQVLRWAQAPDLTGLSLAAAAALCLLALVAATVAGCEVLAIGLGRLIRAEAARGWRAAGLDRPARVLAQLVAIGMAAGLFAGLAGLALWSVSGPWPFPRALPQAFSLQVWRQAGQTLAGSTGHTLALGAISTILALILGLALLQSGARQSRGWLTVAIYLPLLVPQVALVPGLSAWLIGLGAGAGWPSVVLGHLIFVLPYVLLSLADPWRSLDPRITQVAASLGASPVRIFWHLRLPMLLPALLTAAAMGFAVSVGQYLPTLLLSGGRIDTLTTEALALSSGGNRRLVGAEAVLQMALPGLGFLLALALPRAIFMHRKAMLGP